MAQKSVRQAAQRRRWMPKQYRAKRVRTGNANRSSGGHRADRIGERDAAVRDAERRAAEAMRQNPRPGGPRCCGGASGVGRAEGRVLLETTLVRRPLSRTGGTPW